MVLAPELRQSADLGLGDHNRPDSRLEQRDHFFDVLGDRTDRAGDPFSNQEQASQTQGNASPYNLNLSCTLFRSASRLASASAVASFHF